MVKALDMDTGEELNTSGNLISKVETNNNPKTIEITIEETESLVWRLNYMPSLGNVNKNYPYPVLGNLDDFDSSNNFTLRVRYGARNGQFEFTCNLEFDSFRTDYDELIKDRKIHFCVLIFNAQTFLEVIFQVLKSK